MPEPVEDVLVDPQRDRAPGHWDNKLAGVPEIIRKVCQVGG
jgi:hypothetical protein